MFDPGETAWGLFAGAEGCKSCIDLRLWDDGEWERRIMDSVAGGLRSGEDSVNQFWSAPQLRTWVEGCNLSTNSELGTSKSGPFRETRRAGPICAIPSSNPALEAQARDRVGFVTILSS